MIIALIIWISRFFDYYVIFFDVGDVDFLKILTYNIIFGIMNIDNAIYRGIIQS